MKPVNELGIDLPWRLTGSPSRTRTCDPAINSRLLYQLSYRGSVKGVPISRGVGDCKARGTAGECGEKAETGGGTPDLYPVVLFVYIRADGASWRSGYAEDCKSPDIPPTFFTNGHTSDGMRTLTVECNSLTL